jgi:hypothetical protein
MPVSVDTSGNKQLARRKAAPKQATVKPGWGVSKLAGKGSGRVPHSRVPVGRPTTGPLAERPLDHDDIADRSYGSNSGDKRDSAQPRSIATDRKSQRDSWSPDRKSELRDGSEDGEMDGPELSNIRRDDERSTDRHERESSTASRPTWKPYR